MTTAYPFHVQRYTERQQQISRVLAGTLELAPEVKQSAGMVLPQRARVSKRK